MPVTVFVALVLQLTPCPCVPGGVSLIGHRGSGVSTPTNPYAENTLPSIAHAFAQGADEVEVDVYLSADGQPVVHHDVQLGRTTSLQGCVSDATAAALQAADATVGSGAEQPTGVPLLADALGLARQFDRRLDVELKVHPGDATCPPTDVPALVGATLRALSETGTESHASLISFSFEALALAKQQRPGVAVALLTGEQGEALRSAGERARGAGFEGINPGFPSLTAGDGSLEALHGLGLRVSPWTVNDGPTQQQLMEAGVEGLITDDLASALAQRSLAEARCGCGEARAGEGTDGGTPLPAGGGGGHVLQVQASGCGRLSLGTSAGGLVSLALVVWRRRCTREARR